MKYSPSSLQELIELENDARNFGFDWPDKEMIIDQAVSECNEIREAIALCESKERLQEEVGDLLHTAISLCIFAGYDVEQTLAKTVEKFGSRMQAVKEVTYKKGLNNLQGKDIDFMMSIWHEAKDITKNKKS